MRTIFKYSFKIDDVVTISMPVGAKVLSVQAQNYLPCVWVQVESKLPLEDRRFAIVGTGNEMPDCKLEYIGTFQNNHFVWHLYEII